jgi:hypothetical protein
LKRPAATKKDNFPKRIGPVFRTGAFCFGAKAGFWKELVPGSRFNHP